MDADRERPAAKIMPLPIDIRGYCEAAGAPQQPAAAAAGPEEPALLQPIIEAKLANHGAPARRRGGKTIVALLKEDTLNFPWAKDTGNRNSRWWSA